MKEFLIKKDNIIFKYRLTKFHLCSNKNLPEFYFLKVIRAGINFILYEITIEFRSKIVNQLYTCSKNKTNVLPVQKKTD